MCLHAASGFRNVVLNYRAVKWLRLTACRACQPILKTTILMTYGRHHSPTSSRNSTHSTGHGLATYPGVFKATSSAVATMQETLRALLDKIREIAVAVLGQSLVSYATYWWSSRDQRIRAGLVRHSTSLTATRNHGRHGEKTHTRLVERSSEAEQQRETPMSSICVAVYKLRVSRTWFYRPALYSSISRNNAPLDHSSPCDFSASSSRRPKLWRRGELQKGHDLHSTREWNAVLRWLNLALSIHQRWKHSVHGDK